MSVFLGLVTALWMVMTVVGLVSPKTLLPKEENPTRRKALGAAAGLWIVLAIGGGIVSAIFGSSDEKPAAQPVAQQEQAVPTRAAAVSKGIGISRAQAAAVLKKQGCTLAKSSDVNGQERWQGQQGMLMCEVIGPEKEIQKIFLLNGIVKDNPSGALDAIVRMNEVVKLAAPGWEESGKWVVNAIKSENDTIIRDGRKIEVRLFPQLGLGVSVAAD